MVLHHGNSRPANLIWTFPSTSEKLNSASLLQDLMNHLPRQVDYRAVQGVGKLWQIYNPCVLELLQQFRDVQTLLLERFVNYFQTK